MSDIIYSRNTLNNKGDRRHPYELFCVLFIRTMLDELQHKSIFIDIILLFIPCFCSDDHNPSRQTRSKVFLKSIKLWYKSFWISRFFSINILQLKICSTVLMFNEIGNACSTESILSTFVFCLSRIILSKTLLACDIRLKVL